MNTRREHRLGNIVVSFWVVVAAIYAMVAPAAGMYDPKHGRWLQRDPIGVNPTCPKGQVLPHIQYSDGADLYQYTLSSPCTHVDPSGKGSREFVPYRSLNEQSEIIKELGGVKLRYGRALTHSQWIQETFRCSEARLESSSFSYAINHPAGGMGRFAFHSKEWKLGLDLELQLSMRVVAFPHSIWKQRQSEYDWQYPQPRTDAEEYVIVLIHEQDHWDTIEKGFWPNMVSPSLARLERPYCTKACCEAVGACVIGKIDELYHQALDHFRSVNHFPDGRLGYNMYQDNPFTKLLDLRECYSLANKPFCRRGMFVPLVP